MSSDRCRVGWNARTLEVHVVVGKVSQKSSSDNSETRSDLQDIPTHSNAPYVLLHLFLDLVPMLNDQCRRYSILSTIEQAVDRARLR